jgi:hypothetical protein
LQDLHTYFGLTLLFMLLPSLVMKLLSFCSFICDYSESTGTQGLGVSSMGRGTRDTIISTKDSARVFRTKEGSPELLLLHLADKDPRPPSAA